MTQHAAALIIGFTIQGLAVARALHRSGIKVYAVDRSADGATAKSADVQYFAREGVKPKELTATLLDLRRHLPEEHIVLFPGSDRTVRALARNWTTLQSHYLLSWADHTELVASLTHKSAALAHADHSGTRYPATARFESIGDVDAAGSMHFPLIVKPDRPPGMFKTFIAASPVELRQFVENRQEQLPFVVQEYIEGGDEQLYFCTLFLDDGVERASMTGRKLRGSPPGRGRGTVIEIGDYPQILTEARRYFAGLVLTGPVSIEFKLDTDGVPWLIEPNVGRTEYCVDAIIQSGLNLPYMEFCLTLGLPIPDAVLTSRAEPVVWFDTQAEPICYLATCWRYRTLRPQRKRPVFPFLGHGDFPLVLHAVLGLLRKNLLWLSGAVGRRLRRVFRLTPLPRRLQ